MPGSWERLDAKQERQRAQVPILVGDLRAAQQAVIVARGAVAAHEQRVKGKKSTAADKKKAAELTKRVDEAVKVSDETVVMVDVQAMHPVDHERLVSAHTSPTGDPDLQSLLPPLMAYSCVDEEMQDEARWAELLARPCWTAGEIDELRMRVLGLNQISPGGLGKG